VLCLGELHAEELARQMEEQDGLTVIFVRVILMKEI
jgi:hypothetical protein